MPLYPDIRPDWLKPENKSVLDNPVKKAIRGLVDLAGGNDPVGQVMGTGGPLDAPVAPLVSLYKGAVAGSPARAAREWMTKAFTEQAKRIYPEHVGPQIEQFAEKYPRVAAHTKLTEFPGLSAEGTTQWSWPISNEPLGFEGSRFGVNIRPSAVADAGSPDLLIHELAHVAQRLGNKQAPELYGLIDTGLKKHPNIDVGLGHSQQTIDNAAYLRNPFEKNARQAAMRKTGKANLTDADGVRRRMAPVSEQVENWLRRDPGNPELRHAKTIFDVRKGVTVPTSGPLQGLMQAGSEVQPASKDSWKHINDFRQGKDIRLSLDPGNIPELPSASGSTKLLGRPRNTGGNPKLRPEAVRYIKELAAAGQPEAELAKQFGVTTNTIQQMLRGESWVKAR